MKTRAAPNKTVPVMSEGALLKDLAYDSIKQRIQDSTFAPGHFLSERQLSSLLQMSKTPVKAALERLEAEGFIAVSPQQGIVVRDLSVHEIADQFELRLAVESFVLRRIAGKLSDDQAARLADNLRWQRQAARQADVAASVRLDTEFHTLFCEFYGNREFLRVMLQLREKMHRVVTRVLSHIPDRLTSSFREHKALADAVLAGEPDQAATTLEEHLNFGKQQLLAPRR